MKKYFTFLVLICGVFYYSFSQSTVSLSPIKDNTLYESASGVLSNGVGAYLFAGRTNQNSNSKRRALLAFNLKDSIPEGATITEARLILTMSKTIGGEIPLFLHRVTTDWGEGVSDAAGEEGAGIEAQPGDATWTFAKFDMISWDKAGGDFDSTVSATQTINAVGSYTWADSQMIADVQYWLDSAEVNFGWILKGNEDLVNPKRFDAKDNANVSSRPRLELSYTMDAMSIAPDQFLPLKLFPNPVDHTFQIEMPLNRETMITIYDLQGRVVLRQQNQLGLIQVRIDQLAAGVYGVVAIQNKEYYRSTLLKR